MKLTGHFTGKTALKLEALIEGGSSDLDAEALGDCFCA